MAKKSKNRKEEEEQYSDAEEEFESDSYDEEEGDSEEEDSDYESDDEPRGQGMAGRKKISQLAFAVGKDVLNPKGKKKEMRRLRQFLGFAGRSVLLTLDDLPEVSTDRERHFFTQTTAH